MTLGPLCFTVSGIMASPILGTEIKMKNDGTGKNELFCFKPHCAMVLSCNVVNFFVDLFIPSICFVFFKGK